MDVASVTLDEVLKAAQLRAASLVPETSGYLALAIADASARLPFRIEDDMVNLSTEGTVKVMRGTDVVQPEESAAVLRDVLDRLLGCSIGSMPGLANASRSRGERETVLDVIGDLESALVPVNRSAARRALARLARETVRARDRGKLDRPVRRARQRPAPPRQEAAIAAPSAPPPAPAAPPAPSAAIAPAAPPIVAPATPTPIAPAPVAVAPPIADSAALAPHATIEVEVVFTEPPTPVEPMPIEPTPTIVASSVDDDLVDQRLEEVQHGPRPSAATPGSTPEPEPEVLVARPRSRRDRRTDEAILETPKSSVGQLLASFRVSEMAAPEVPELEPALDDATVRPSSVRPLSVEPASARPPVAGKSTPSPSVSPDVTGRRVASAAPVKKAAAAAAAMARAARSSLAPVDPDPSGETPAPSPALALAPAARFQAWHFALLAVALVVAGLVGHFAPRMF